MEASQCYSDGPYHFPAALHSQSRRYKKIGQARLCFHVDMKALRIADSATTSLGLEGEIRRSEESRSDHRL